MKTNVILTSALCIAVSMATAQNVSYNLNSSPIPMGNFNSGFGMNVLMTNISGVENTGTGYDALIQNSTGNWNTATGFRSLMTNMTGDYNTAIGYLADVGASGLTNATAIGANAVVTANNSIQLGDGNVTQIFGGTGTNATFISGGLQITGGIPGVGKVLTSNASGVATWQNLPAFTGWGTIGNAGTVDGTNFVGTTDNVPLNFRVNNQKAGRIDGNLANTFFGYQAGNVNNGTSNNAFGAEALYSNNGGNQNIAIGYRAMRTNSNGSNNVVLGTWALINNVSGNNNIAIGSTALPNSNSSNNTGVGTDVLYHTNSGFDNTAVGREGLYFNTTGDGNTSIGNGALYWTGSGNDNTGLGYWSNLTVGTLNNATAVGANAWVNASDKVVIGSTAVSVIGGYATAGWSNLSDARFKENVKDDAAGLDFIMKLRPVTYTFNMKKLDEHLMQNMPDSIKQARMQSAEAYGKASQMVSTGFIAQEVESTVKEMGIKFDGVNAPKNPTDNYSIGYAKFVVPLVKAVQEQQQMIQQLEVRLSAQDEMIEQLRNQKSGSTSMIEQSLGNDFAMEQNIPNPFTNETVIKYNLPQQYNSAYMAVYDLTGKQITKLALTDRGNSSITLTSDKLSAGIYIYSIIADGKIMDSKRMVVADK